jgi:cell division septation protein DedD
MMMSEMQSQLNALKAQMIDMKSNQQAKPAWSPVTSKPAIPSWQIQDPSNTATTTTTTTTTSSNPKTEEKVEANKPEGKKTYFTCIYA